MGQEYIRRVSVIGNVPQQGDVIYADDFESTYRWLTTASGNGTAVKSSSDSLSLANSLLMTSDTAAPADNQTVMARRRLFLPQSAQISFGVSFSSTALRELERVQLRAIWLDGVNQNVATIAYLRLGTQIQIFTDSGTQIIPNSVLSLSRWSWHRLSFSINFLTRQYINVKLDNRLYDVSALSYAFLPDSSASLLDIEILMQINTAASQFINFDDVLISNIL